MNVSVYSEGYYEEITAAWARKNKANSKPIANAGLGADWIPSFAGMTNMESLHGEKS